MLQLIKYFALFLLRGFTESQTLAAVLILPPSCYNAAYQVAAESRVSYLMDSNQSGYELHHHDLNLKALF